ncbi:WbqC family protein [Psychrobacillus sp. NPDC096389]|uniref:WbqC family protein n=1 Tax=Psychrobacillus sp. NPDC096389 TaxID=3364490 RepID=UPI0037F46817
MKIGIMQPYFFPYIGYFQLMNAVDKFIVYDDIQYTKSGWINRNRIRNNDKDFLFTIPIKKGSSYESIIEKEISSDFSRDNLIGQINTFYKNAPYYYDVIPLIKEIIMYDTKNLFKYIFNSIIKVKKYLGLDTKILISSSIPIENSLKSTKKVISICKATSGNIYINLPGGKELYSKDIFIESNLELKFIESNPILYNQSSEIFIENLSIIDVLMFNDLKTIKKFLCNYNLV